jgi:methionyl-tRNA formyltransferase
VTPFTGSWEIDHDCKIGVIASFGHMVPAEFIDSFALGMYVMHPSLLPKYRGACPIQHAILNQDSETGVSVIEISKDKFDAGNILAQEKVPLTSQTRFDQLSP